MMIGVGGVVLDRRWLAIKASLPGLRSMALIVIRRLACISGSAGIAASVVRGSMCGLVGRGLARRRFRR